MLLGIVLIIILLIIAAIISSNNNSIKEYNDNISESKIYADQYIDNPMLERLFRDIEQSFLQQINNIYELEKQGKYRTLFNQYGPTRQTREIKLVVDVSDYYATVDISCSDLMGDARFVFVHVSAQLNLYNIAFPDDDYSIKQKKEKGLAIAIIKRVIKLLPKTITTGTFYLAKEDDTYKVTEFHVEKELIVYNTIKDTTYLL